MLTVGYREALALTLNENQNYSKGRRINDSRIAKVEVQQCQYWLNYRLTLEDGEVIEMTHAGPYNIWWKTSQTTPTALPWIDLATGILPSPTKDNPHITETVVIQGKYEHGWTVGWLNMETNRWYDIFDDPITPPTHFFEIT